MRIVHQFSFIPLLHTEVIYRFIFPWIGVATALSARGPFVDTGVPLLCGTQFETLDPKSFDDPATGN